MDQGSSDIGYEVIIFPDGQPHIKISKLENFDDDRVLIQTRLRNPVDLMILVLAVDVLRARGYQKICCAISYLLGARMDRRVDKNQPFTLKWVAKVINDLGFEFVKIFDPHSDVAAALIDRSSVATNKGLVRHVLEMVLSEYEVVLIAPDAGAAKKVAELGLAFNKPVVQATKHRNTSDGKLGGFKVHATKEELEGKVLIIVDDICDGGGTFIGLGEELWKFQPAGINLVVSHGIFSRGLEPIKESYDLIFTTDSFADHKSDDFLKVTPLRTIL